MFGLEGNSLRQGIYRLIIVYGRSKKICLVWNILVNIGKRIVYDVGKTDNLDVVVLAVSRRSDKGLI